MVAEFLERVAHCDGGFCINEEDNITAGMICEMLRTAPLFVGMSLSLAMNMCPPARLRALGSEWYNASLWIARTMLLAL